jgi:hypothetical protein
VTEINSEASKAGRLRRVRKSTRPRGALRRDVQQVVAALGIADPIEFYELFATSEP